MKPKEIHAILTETLACFLPGRTKDLKAALYGKHHSVTLPMHANLGFFSTRVRQPDRLCGLLVRVSDYRYRGPGFDPRRYQIF